MSQECHTCQISGLATKRRDQKIMGLIYQSRYEKNAFRNGWDWFMKWFILKIYNILRVQNSTLRLGNNFQCMQKKTLGTHTRFEKTVILNSRICHQTTKMSQLISISVISYHCWWSCVSSAADAASPGGAFCHKMSLFHLIVKVCPICMKQSFARLAVSSFVLWCNCHLCRGLNLTFESRTMAQANN